MLKIIQKRKIWYVVSVILFVGSIVLYIVLPPRFSIDFTGGSLLEVRFAEPRPEKSAVEETLKAKNLSSLLVQPSGDTNYVIRTEQIDEARRGEVLSALQEKFPGSEQQRFDSIGPTIGQELREKSIISITLVVIGIIAYIAYAFRKISRPVASWKYGVVAIVALFHDIIILGGIYVLASRFLGYEIDTLFVSALLTILGYSVNDTIVTFDRIRDNLARSRFDNFEEMVNKSLNQVLIRSLNTGVASLFVLLALYLFGGESIKPFAFTLFFGIVVGTYSSIFVASPLLVSWQLRSSKK